MTDTTSCVRTKPLNEADYGNAADNEQIVVKTRDGTFEVKAKSDQDWIEKSIFAVTDTDDNPIPHGDAAVGDNASRVEKLNTQISELEAENTVLTLASGTDDTVSKKRVEVQNKIAVLKQQIMNINKDPAANGDDAEEEKVVSGDAAEEEKVVSGDDAEEEKVVSGDDADKPAAELNADADKPADAAKPAAETLDGDSDRDIIPPAVNPVDPGKNNEFGDLDLGGGKRRKTSKKGHKSTRKGRKSVKKGGKTRKKGRRGKGSRRSKK